MEFKKWYSITNHYRQKEIAWWLETHPELEHNTFYVILEKLHGSNFQWHFLPGKPVRAGSRKQYLDMDGSFQGASIPKLMADNAEIITCLQKLSDSTGHSIRLFGELIGRGVIKGVDYGEEKRILYFGMMVDEKLLAFAALETLQIDGLQERLVPVLDRVLGLQAALDFDTKFDSTVLGKSDNICEGVVIQPYAQVYYDRYGNSPFLLKKRNKEFEEKTKVKKPRVVDTEAERLHEEFKLYLTDNRLQSVFSKEGEIDNPGQIGDYIRWLIADVKVDFLLDFEEVAAMDKKKQKAVFNCGKIVVGMLKGYL